MSKAIRMYVTNEEEKSRKLAVKVAVEMALQGHYVILWSNRYTIDELEQAVKGHDASDLHCKMLEATGILRMLSVNSDTLDFDKVEAQAEADVDLFVQI